MEAPSSSHGSTLSINLIHEREETLYHSCKSQMKTQMRTILFNNNAVNIRKPSSNLSAVPTMCQVIRSDLGDTGDWRLCEKKKNSEG